MLNFTLILEMIDPAGRFTLSVAFAPLAVLSGTFTLIGPEEMVVDTGDTPSMVNFLAGSPKHIVTDAGVTIGALGV